MSARLVRIVAFVCCTTACGRLGYERVGDGARDGSIDGARIDGSVPLDAVSAEDGHAGTGDGGLVFDAGAPPDGGADASAGIDAGPPACPSAAARVAVFDSGEEMGCAVRMDGSLWCWGNNARGQLGQGDTAWHENPVRVGVDTNWQLVSAGRNHACGLRADGSAWCWGSNSSGELGTGAAGDSTLPVRVATTSTFERVAAGRPYTCGISSGGLWCWGAFASAADTPTRLGTGSDWTEISAGSFHLCGLRGAGEVWCLGSNGAGQLGTGDTTARAVPTPVTGLGGPAMRVSASAGGSFTCAVRVDGTLWCWGANADGQLGVGDTSPRSVPTQVGTDADWADVSAGAWHACGVRTDGSLWCWGLEVAPGGGGPVPGHVGAVPASSTVSSGEYHGGVVDRGAYPWGFGGNTEGQTGLPASSWVDVPTPVCL